MTTDLALELLKNMLRVRRFEETCAELYTQEKIRGFLHLYIGEEAVATGVMAQLRAQDNVVATYREHGHALLKGVSARAVMAEMFGKVTGCSHGRGGSMHLYSKEQRFYGGNAIVASGLPHAVGLALAAKMLQEDRVTVCFFGDGAVAEGDFHESMNLASLWQLPVLFCCENNFYAMGTALHRHQAQTDLAKKAESYNITSTVADGMNVYDVYEKTQTALQFIREKQQPAFVEFKTYRFRPHSMFDPDLYRSKEEIEQWKQRCPIEFLKKDLRQKNELTEEKLQTLEAWVQSELYDAVEFAEASDWEEVRNLEKDVYCEGQL